MADVIRVLASVRLLTTEEGGRSTPIRGDYRPNHNFFGPDSREMTPGFMMIPEGVELHPGQSMQLPISLWSWPGIEGRIVPGLQWRIQEGATLVGIGTVIELLGEEP